MAPSKIRKALGAVKDRTSISIAKVSNSNSVSDLEVAIVKATRHEEQPAEEKYIKEILSLTCYSRAYISSCVNTLSKRLNKTKNWTVALKTLMLIHRLLSEGDPAYEQEIFFATRRGTRLLNMSDFRDTSGSGSCWDYSAFVRTYALYLDEQLEFRMHGRRRAKHSSPIIAAVSGGGGGGGGGDEDEDQQSASSSLRTTPVREMKTERIFTRTQHLQQLMDRFLACRPTGAAKSNRVVIVALYPIVKESFHIYYDLTEILGILIDRFMQLEISDCVKVQDIFTRIAKQFDELDCFYNWCKAVGIARSSEYPEVEKIAAKKLDIMDEFIREKSSLAQNKRIRNTEVIYELKDEEPEINRDEEDMNAIKALPPPEDFTIEEENIPQQKIEEDMVEESNNANEEQEADLLNLLDGVVTSEEQGDQLALALFDGGETSAAPAWEAFSAEDSGDWENALVISASNLKNQTTTLAGGFDMLLLNGMYQQQAATVASGVSAATGSASSVALGSSGKPTMLALPAPPTSSDNNGSTNTLVCADPFAASLAVAPPAYVQMSEMEKKQKLLIEEQIMWEHYARDGKQGHGHGHVGMTNQLQTNSYGMGGYTTQSY